MSPSAPRRSASPLVVLLASAVLLAIQTRSVEAQFTFASDNATNYSTSANFTAGSNRGTGFNAWSFNNGASTGTFIGNPATDGMSANGIGTTAFGFFSNQNGNYFNVSRSAIAAMQIGDSMSFQWTMLWDTDAVGLNKGIVFQNSGNDIFSINNSNSSNITVNGIIADTLFGNGTMSVTVNRTSSDQYSFSMTRRGNGTTYTATIGNSTAIDSFKIYGSNNNADAQRNIYFNNFQVTNSGNYSSGGSVTSGWAYTGFGALVVGNSTTLILTNDGNTFTGGTTVDAGSTLQIGNGGGSGSLPGSVVNNGAVTFNRTGDVTYNGTMSGSGALNKQGGGALFVNGSNSYTGTTTISAGTLEAQHANALGTSAAGTTVASGAVLKLYNGTGMTIANEALSINGTGVSDGGALINSGGDNTWSGAVTLAGNTRINADTTGSNGSLTISGGIDGGSNALFLGTQGGTGGRTGGDITLSGPVGGAGAVLASHANTTTSLFKDGLGALTLSGSSNFTGATLLNQGTILVGNNNAFGNGVVQVHWDNTTDTKTIASTNETARTFANNLNIYNNVTLGAVDRIGNLNFIGAVDLGSEAGNRTITTAAGTSHAFSGNVAGLRQIIKEGTGSLALGGSNTFSGGVQLNNGTILIGSNTALGSGTLQVQFDIAGTKTIASADATARSITNNVNVFNDLTIGQASGGTGSLSLGGIIFLGNEVGQNRIFTVVGTHAITGNITGNRGIVKQGTGTLTASGVNTSTGGVYIDDGAFNLDGGSIAFSGIDIGSGVDGSQSPNNATLRVSSNSTYSQNLFVQNAGNSTGARTIDFANTSGTGTLSGSVSLNKTAAVAVATGGTGVLSGQVSGAGGITKSNAGLLRLGGNNTYNGTTSIEGGALEVSSANALGSTAGNTAVSSGAALQLAGDTTIATEALSLNGSGQSNGGALRSVSGNNSYNGAITLAASSRINSDAGTLNLGGGITGASQNLTIGGAGNTVVGSVIGTTTGSLAKDGAGTLTLNAQNTYNGTTTVNAGTLALGHATNTLADSSSVAVAGGELALGSNSDTVASFAISNGTLAGSGTLAAATYALQGGTVNANLGAGTANVTTGTTTLNGTLAANTVNINSGNLTLGAADRLDNSANVTVSGGTLNLGANNDTVGSLTLNGTLAGTGTLTAATYALQGGTVNAGLGNGSVAVSAGTTVLGSAGRLHSGSTVAINSGQLTLGGNETVSGFALNSGTLGGNGTLTASVYDLQSGTVVANLGAGTANVTTGTTTLNGTLAANTVNINSGNLTLGSADRLADGATVSVSGGTLNLGANNDTVGSLTLNGTLAGSGNLTAATYALQGGAVNANLGAGTANVTGAVALSGTMNSTALNILTGGNLSLSSSNRIGSGSVDINGGTLSMGSFDDTVGAVTLRGEGTLAGSGTLTGSSFDLQGGTVNAALGNATVTVSTGTTTLGSAGRLNSGSSLAINSGQLNLGGAESVGALSGSGGTLNLGANTLTTSVPAGSSTFSGTITGTGGGLTKAGAGELILTGASDYSGATTVSAGTLRVNGSLGATAVSVGNAATLAGNATIGGLVTLNTGGTLSPGNSVGTMNFSSGLVLNSGGNVTMEITDATTFDTITVGDPGIQYGGNLSIVLGSFVPAHNSTYQLFVGTKFGGSFENIFFSDSFDGTGSTFDYDTGTLTVVPEPSTWALIGVGAAFVLWRLRRRKA